MALLRPFAFRALIVWLAFHVGLAWASRGDTIILRPLALGGLAIIGGGIGLMDARRRHELLFLRNLGVHPMTIALTCAVTIVVAEVAVAALIAPLMHSI